MALHPDGHQIFQCFACGKRGSVIDLYAAINNLTTAQAIRKLGDADLPELSKEEILQRIEDAVKRDRQGFDWIIQCNSPGCGKIEFVTNEKLIIMAAGGSWQWMISPNLRKAQCWPQCELITEHVSIAKLPDGKDPFDIITGG